MHLAAGSTPVIDPQHLTDTFGQDPTPAFRLVIATVAASLARMASSIRATAFSRFAPAPRIATEAQGVLPQPAALFQAGSVRPFDELAEQE